jgi:mono/diheme cytochrome c family protein
MKGNRLEWGAGLLVSAVVACCAALPAAAQDVRHGRAIAEAWCAQCHLVGPGGPGVDLAPPFEAIARDPARSDDWLRAWLSDPHPPMPDLDLTRLEIEDLLAYLRSLGPGGAAGEAAPAIVEERSVGGDAARGEAFAETACASCHIIGPALQPQTGSQTAPPFPTVARAPTTTVTGLYIWLQSPHPTMPQLMLTEEQLSDVVTYIWSLRAGAD